MAIGVSLGFSPAQLMIMWEKQIQPAAGCRAGTQKAARHFQDITVCLAFWMLKSQDQEYAVQKCPVLIVVTLISTSHVGLGLQGRSQHYVAVCGRLMQYTSDLLSYIRQIIVSLCFSL